MLNIETYKPELFPDLIERFWIGENGEKDVDLIVPPNQYVSLIFPLHKSSYKRKDIWIDTPQLEGFSTENTVLSYPAGTRLLGIRFFAFGLYPFIQTQGKKIINNTLNLAFDNEELQAVISHSDNESDTELIQKLDAFLSKLYCEKAYREIVQIMDFYKEFRWNDESQSIEQFCKNTGTNYTTLNRNFNRIIGITSKKFERLIKFRKSLCDLIDTQESLTSIGAGSGYFDQAHFIREFKIFLNQTPSEYKSFIKLADKESKIVNYNFNLY